MTHQESNLNLNDLLKTIR